MVYDSANGRVILFGGDTGRTDTSVSPNDTWAYDPSANKWTERSPLGDVPSGRSDYSIAYDSGAGKVILFGGVGGDGFTLSDTWGYGATPLGGGSSAGTGITAAINETTSPTAGAGAGLGPKRRSSSSRPPRRRPRPPGRRPRPPRRS